MTNIQFFKAVKKPIPVDVVILSNSLWNDIFNEENHKIKINGYTLEASFLTEEYLYPSKEEKSGVISVPEETKIFFVNTLEDINEVKLHKAKIDDYLIIGVHKEIYACDKEIFEKTYDIVKKKGSNND